MELKNQDIKKINPDSGPVLCLDGLQDPGNVGTIIRIADWFGLPYLVLGANCADPFSPKVVQASMGSIFRVSVFETKLEEYLDSLPGSLPVYGAVMDGKNIYRQNPERKSILILGNESHGISPEIQEKINVRITIPPSDETRPGPESLNVSVACGIILSEFFR